MSRVTQLTIAAAAAVLLAGCGDGSGPVTLPSASAPSSVSGTMPTETTGDAPQATSAEDDARLEPADRPEAAPTSHTTPSSEVAEREVEAAVRKYFSIANTAFRTGSLDGLENVVDGRCPCDKFVRDIGSFVSEGGKYDGAKYRVASVRVHDVIGVSAAAEVIGSMSPYRMIDSDGGMLEDSPGGEVHGDYSVALREGKWLIVNAVDLRS